MLNTNEALAAVKAASALYPHGVMDRAKRDAMRAEYDAEHDRINDELRAWLADEFASELAPEVQAAVWRKAWSDGHSSGLRAVADEYEEIAKIANLAASTGLHK